MQKLSPREREVVRLACEGLVDKEIAVRLKIGVGTVKTHWERVRTKLHCRTRAQIIARLLLESQMVLDGDSAGHLALRPFDHQRFIGASEAPPRKR